MDKRQQNQSLIQIDSSSNYCVYITRKAILCIQTYRDFVFMISLFVSFFFEYQKLNEKKETKQWYSDTIQILLFGKKLLAILFCSTIKWNCSNIIL